MEEWILKISAGKASRDGIFDRINDICLYDLECWEQSSKHIQQSNPLSLNLSIIEIPIKGIIKDNRAADEECVDIRIKNSSLPSCITLWNDINY